MKEKIEINLNTCTAKLIWESFWVPTSLAQIQFQIQIPKHLRCITFFAVYDEKQKLRMQCLLSYGELHFSIGDSPERNTPGAIMGAVNAGQWSLLIGKMFEGEENPIEQESVVTVEITDEETIAEQSLDVSWMKEETGFNLDKTLFPWEKVFDTKAGWYKGDFHTHTRLSDGKELIENAMKKAKDMDLDFYVPTEHNLWHTGWKKTDLLVLPGVEVTTDLGHFNIFGITERPEEIDKMLMAATADEVAYCMTQIIEVANQKEWPVSINHPFLHVWKWHLRDISLDRVQCLEIINDPTYMYAKDANEEAISFLDCVWESGIKIYAVGGSDSHNLIEERYESAVEPSIPGDPATYVYCNSLTADTLLEGVRKGRMVVARHCRVIPHIYSHVQNYFPGDEITENEITYEAEICGIKDYPEVFLIGNTGENEVTRMPLQVIKTENGTYKVKKKVRMNVGYWKWLRLEVREHNGDFLAYVNPIYAGEKKECHRTFGEIENVWKQV